MKDKKLGNSFRHAYDIGQLNDFQQSGLLTAKDKQDFYRFKIGGNSKGSDIKYSVPLPMRGVDVQLFKGDRTSVEKISQALTLPPLSLTRLKPGTYYFKVSDEGIQGKRKYSLTASVLDRSSGGSSPGSSAIDLTSSSTNQVALITRDQSSALIPNSGAIFIDEFPTIVENQINGSKEDDLLLGDDRSNGISGKGGNDQLFGQGSFDVLDGGSGNDRLSGGDDGDRLFGNRGNDTLIGGSGDDTLYGDAGNDRLRGGAGNDVLIGGNGDNRLVGGGGGDGFVLSLGRAFDTVVDFQDGLDRLGLPTGVGFEKLEIFQQGADTAVLYVENPFSRMMPPPIALLKGVQANTITAADFANVVTVS
jgi:RTX calcium-binding nonapeptide repeat (4 copies)